MSRLFEGRDYYKPFAYPACFEAYRDMQKMHWLPSQVPLAEDINDWRNNLTDGERALLTQLFRFFTQADVDVARAYIDVYMPKFPHPEIRMMLAVIAAAEANHIDSYAHLVDTLGLPESEFRAFQQIKSMMDKHEYFFKTTSEREGLPELERLALDMAIFSGFGEGLQLFGSFAVLMSFQNVGLMKGMSTIVEWSIRDENRHVEAMTDLFHTLIGENPHIWTDDFKRRIYQAARDMVDLEMAFADAMFDIGEARGITKAELEQYIKYLADRRLNQLGLKSNFGVDENPLDWLDWLVEAPGHVNFFEQRPTEYAKSYADDGEWAEAFE